MTTTERVVPGRGAARLRSGEVVGNQAARTIARIHAAGTAAFDAFGYHRASVDQIVAEAGISRGTFYKYFDDKLDLLACLSAEAEAAFLEVLATCPSDPTSPELGAELRRWLSAYAGLLDRYASVFRVWIERSLSDDVILDSGERVGRAAMKAFTRLLRPVPRTFERQDTLAALLLIGLIERLPYLGTGPEPLRTPEQLVEMVATFVERALVNPGHRSGS